jgi:transcriptional regulator with XRE-family HTH domain
MPMTPIEIKVELLRKGLTLAGIARDLNVSGAHVSQVVSGKRRSQVVERAVAEAIGKPVARVFKAA